MTSVFALVQNYRSSFYDAMKRLLVSALVLSSCLITASALADAEQGNLVINASGFADESGQAVANLFRAGDDVLHPPHTFVTASIKNGKATLIFPQLPYGSYAVSVFHDKNSNNKIDHIFFTPAEPLGFSNGFEISLFAGLPSFEKLRFSFDADTKPLDIAVRTVH